MGSIHKLCLSAARLTQSTPEIGRHGFVFIWVKNELYALKRWSNTRLFSVVPKVGQTCATDRKRNLNDTFTSKSPAVHRGVEEIHVPDLLLISDLLS